MITCITTSGFYLVKLDCFRYDSYCLFLSFAASVSKLNITHINWIFRKTKALSASLLNYLFKLSIRIMYSSLQEWHLLYNKCLLTSIATLANPDPYCTALHLLAITLLNNLNNPSHLVWKCPTKTWWIITKYVCLWTDSQSLYIQCMFIPYHMIHNLNNKRVPIYLEIKKIWETRMYLKFLHVIQWGCFVWRALRQHLHIKLETYY